jgi:type I restriction enzyme R subunit
VVGAEPRIASVAADLVAHFEERNQAQTGKAMVVAMSRDICVHLYDEIVRCAPTGTTPTRKGRHQDRDDRLGQRQGAAAPHIYSAQVKKRLEKRFKDPADPLRWSSCATCG